MVFTRPGHPGRAFRIAPLKRRRPFDIRLSTGPWPRRSAMFCRFILFFFRQFFASPIPFRMAHSLRRSTLLLLCCGTTTGTKQRFFFFSKKKESKRKQKQKATHIWRFVFRCVSLPTRTTRTRSRNLSLSLSLSLSLLIRHLLRIWKANTSKRGKTAAHTNLQKKSQHVTHTETQIKTKSKWDEQDDGLLDPFFCLYLCVIACHFLFSDENYSAKRR